MSVIKGAVRRSQLITTYGVGSVVAVEDESFMIAGLDFWDVTHADLHEPRLEAKLRVQGFASPPASNTERRPDIPVIRFPQKHYCRACRRLDDHGFFATWDRNDCSACGVRLVPSRFVVACAKGHIDDFPYFSWVHAGSPREEREHELTIESRGTTASLRDIVVRCKCGKSVDMDGAFGKEALRGLGRCRGRKPWLGRDVHEECDEVPRTLQRGAANVWFSVTESAISIPPWSEGAYKLLNRAWSVLRHVNDDATVRGILQGMNLQRGTSYTVEDLVTAARARRLAASDAQEENEVARPLRPAEYEALVRGKPEVHRDQEFVTEPADRGPEAERWFEQVVLVKRLREVRALRGFTRVEPSKPGDGGPSIAELSETALDWLPAMEVTGEGVFLRLDQDHVESWESRPAVVERADRIDKNYRDSFVGETTPDRAITPRLLLLHSLSHALINEWSLSCGYPAASLRERLYCDDDMAGMLIFTATSDSAGSLGGVTGLGQGDILDDTLRQAIERSAWCSADPVCLEASPHGLDALNLAACHACLLLPEVSCEERNVLLDRAMLVGDGETPNLGFFEPMLTDR